jgi:NAD+ synthase
VKGEIMIKPDCIEKLLDDICADIKDFTDQAILGVSGGADSTLMACILKRALGAANVHAVSMPFSATDYAKFNDNSDRIAQKLMLNHHIKDIESSVNAVGGKPKLSALNHGNLRSRIRTVYLYTYNQVVSEATGQRCRVIGTGNKSEDYIGYDTKGGDALADIFPIGRLFKSEVYQLLDYFVSLGWLDEDMIDRIPSAGLEEGQTDEGDLGYSYDDMEGIIRYLEENDNRLGKLDWMCEATVFVHDRYHANKHKHEAQHVVDVHADYFEYT